MNTTHLNNVVLVDVNISMISGRFKLTEGDLGLKMSLPPEELASLGSMKYVNSDLLDPGNRLKRQVERKAKSFGINTRLGTFIPIRDIDEFTEYLDDAKQEFNQFKQSVLTEIDNSIEEWIKKYPRWETQIRNKAKDSSYISQRMNFEYTAIKINMPNDDEHDSLSNSYTSINGNLKSGLFEWVADTVSSYAKLQDRLEQNLGISLKHLRKVKNDILPKLHRFAFLDGRASILIDRIDKLLPQAITLAERSTAIDGNKLLTPERGPFYQNVKNLFQTLIDVDAIRALKSDTPFVLENNKAASPKPRTPDVIPASKPALPSPAKNSPQNMFKTQQSDFAF